MKKPKGATTAKRGLTPKQTLFIKYYLAEKNLNATAAAKKAGYSEKTAHRIGAENVQKPAIKKEIDEALAKRADKCDVDALWLLKRLITETTADLADLYDEHGGLKSIHDWPLIWRQGLVGGLDVEQQYETEGGHKVPSGVIVKLKLSDRTKRLEMLGKHTNIKAFADQLEILGLPKVIVKDLAGGKLIEK